MSPLLAMRRETLASLQSVCCEDESLVTSVLSKVLAYFQQLVALTRTVRRWESVNRDIYQGDYVDKSENTSSATRTTQG